MPASSSHTTSGCNIEHSPHTTHHISTPHTTSGCRAHTTYNISTHHIQHQHTPHTISAHHHTTSGCNIEHSPHTISAHHHITSGCSVPLFTVVQKWRVSPLITVQHFSAASRILPSSSPNVANHHHQCNSTPYQHIRMQYRAHTTHKCGEPPSPVQFNTQMISTLPLQPIARNCTYLIQSRSYGKCKRRFCYHNEVPDRCSTVCTLGV